jgi:hypothetical protein
MRLVGNATGLVLRHGIGTQHPTLRRNTRVARLPSPQTLLCVVESLSCQLGVVVGWALLAGHNGRVVEQVDELSRLGREQDLLLGSLDHGGGVDVVGFFELLAGDVGELSLGDERLGFGADEFLLEGDELGGLGLFVLQFLDLILDLDVVSCTARLLAI